MLGDQFVPAQVADSSALQFEFQKSLVMGKLLPSDEVLAEQLSSLGLLSSQSAFSLLGLVVFGVANERYHIVQSGWWIREAGLRPQDE